MLSKQWFMRVAIFMVAILILIACQPETVTETVEVTRVVEVESDPELVEVTREVTSETVILAAMPALGGHTLRLTPQD